MLHKNTSLLNTEYMYYFTNSTPVRLLKQI